MRRLILTIVASLLLSISLFAQSADSTRDASQHANQDRQARQGTLSEQAARGEIPFSFADERLRPDVRKIRRLPPNTLPLRPDEIGNPRQIGVIRDFEPPLRLSADSASFDVDGGKVYLLGVISQGAKSVRVKFSQVNLPDGVRVFAFPLENSDEFYGPFTKSSPLPDGTFWTPPVQGEAIVVECFIPNGHPNPHSDYFLILFIAHNLVGNGEGLLQPALPCHNEVGTGYASTATAVGYLEFVDPLPPCRGTCICTGTLLNTAAVNFAPFLLTANHCIHSESVAQTLKVFWNYNTGDSPPFGTFYQRFRNTFLVITK